MFHVMVSTPHPFHQKLGLCMLLHLRKQGRFPRIDREQMDKMFGELIPSINERSGYCYTDVVPLALMLNCSLYTLQYYCYDM